MADKIDVNVPLYLRPRRPGWPSDAFCRSYSSEIIPKFYRVDASWESKATPWTRRWLKENDMLLKEQREKISPVVSKTKEDRRRAAQDAKLDMRDYDKQEKLDRRDAAIEAGDCSADYTGSSKDECRGRGIGGECFRCFGQVLKLDDVTPPTLHCELLNG